MTWPFKERRNERGEVELLRALLQLANQLQSNLDFEAVVRAIATAASETFGFGEAAVLVREQGAVLRAHAVVDGGHASAATCLDFAVPVEAVEKLCVDRHRIGDSFFLAGNDPDWERVGLHCLSAHGPVTKSAWNHGDTLLIPLRDQMGQLSGLLRLGSPSGGGKPTLQTISLLGVFATHAVVAIDNAWEHRELQRVKGQLEEELQVQHDLAQVSRTLLAELDQQTVFDEIARALGQMVHYDAIGIALVESGATALTPAFADPPEARALIESEYTIGHPLIAPVVGERRALLVDEDHDGPLPRLHGADRPTGAMILAPLSTGERVFGILSIGRDAGSRFNAREFELTVLFANLAAIAVQNARTYREMERLAISDGLTGMYNYRHFREVLANEVSRADRYDETFCLLMMDLDHFKAVNDTVGHQQGDEVLRAVAAVLRQCSRESDFMARYGGEEFVMILPRTPLREAHTVAERIRRRVRDIDAGSPALRVSMSLGVAAYPHSSTDMDGVLRAADSALLRAKAGGRNRVQLYDGVEVDGVIDHTDRDLDLARRFATAVGLSETEASGVVAALVAARLSGTDAPSRLEPGPQPYRPLRGVGASWSGHGPGREAFEALLYATENWDGTGYPEGLSGIQIPEVARVYAVCRRYAQAERVEPSTAQEQLWRSAGGELDPRLVQRFLILLREFDSVEREPRGRRQAG
jgi:diguanylate cyclase (GGDEF)-like protein